MIKSIIGAAALLLTATVASADVSYNEDTKSLTISGPTSSLQSVMAKRAFANNEIDTVYMWGPGGEFYAGLGIGRMIRDANVRVIVPTGKECVSACAFAALGSGEIIADGVLLFHRPYFKSVPTIATTEQIAAAFGLGYVDMTAYLVEMMGDVGFSASKAILELTSPCSFIATVGDEVVLFREGYYQVLPIVDKCNPA